MQAITLVQFSDIHLGSREGDPIKGFDADRYWQAAMEHASDVLAEADVVVLSGDLTHDAGVPAYRRIVRLADQFGGHVLSLPGNHDDIEAMVATLNEGRFMMPFRVELGDWQLFFLDSSVEGQAHGHLDAQTLQDLEAELAAHPEQPALIFLHHQPLPVGSAWLDELGLDNGHELQALLSRQANVLGVVFGHVHQVMESNRLGVTYLSCPATCVQFAPDAEAFALGRQLPGYRVFRLMEDGSFKSQVTRFHPRLRQIVAGGQTGVDRGALEAALSLGLAHGGWCPKGRKAEDAGVPARYRLWESPSTDYADRTRRNVDMADGTLILHRGELNGGTALTVSHAEAQGKPLLQLNLEDAPDVPAFNAWLDAHRIRRLNVAGPRESKAAGIQLQSEEYLSSLLTGVDVSGNSLLAQEAV